VRAKASKEKIPLLLISSPQGRSKEKGEGINY
jgi:hypothetical protein